MTMVLSAFLRYLLILALGLNGIAFAQAAPAFPAVSPAQAATAQGGALPAVTPGPASGAAAAQEDHCHDLMAGKSPSLQTAAPADAATPHGCCKGGVCACTCAAPASLTAFFLATPVPVAHERAVPLRDYRPSHLLPLPFRPPIA